MMKEDCEERDSHGKYGTKKHRMLIERALHHAIDRYFDRYGPIEVLIENNTIKAEARLTRHHYGYSSNSSYEINPDIVFKALKEQGGDDPKKVLVIECETTKYNMLSDEVRLTAYKLLRMKHSDKSKFMMYIAFPEELKGDVEKPECFNDLWFFDMSDVEEEDGC